MEEMNCKTKYPLMLIHGTGFRDLRIPLYWGRIPRVLKENGAAVYFGEQDCWGSVETNAHAICARIDAILKETGAEKINLIGHSKGGVEAGLDPETSLALAIQTVHGAAKMLENNADDIDTMIKKVCSPGGSTIEGVKKLDEADMEQAVVDAVSAAYKRNIELGKS